MPPFYATAQILTAQSTIPTLVFPPPLNSSYSLSDYTPSESLTTKKHLTFCLLNCVKDPPSPPLYHSLNLCPRNHTPRKHFSSPISHRLLTASTGKKGIYPLAPALTQLLLFSTLPCSVQHYCPTPPSLLTRLISTTLSYSTSLNFIALVPNGPSKTDHPPPSNCIQHYLLIQLHSPGGNSNMNQMKLNVKYTQDIVSKKKRLLNWPAGKYSSMGF
eukprot:gene10806-22552_t